MFDHHEWERGIWVYFWSAQWSSYSIERKDLCVNSMSHERFFLFKCLEWAFPSSNTWLSWTKKGESIKRQIPATFIKFLIRITIWTAWPIVSISSSYRDEGNLNFFSITNRYVLRSRRYHFYTLLLWYSGVNLVSIKRQPPSLRNLITQHKPCKFR